MSYDPEAILWLGFTSKDKAVQERFNNFLKVWPEAHQRIPYALMQEMRITPELPTYAEIVQGIFLELIDGHLTTPEEMRAYLEPHSPPAPPPQVTIKRPRVRRSEAKIKEPAFDEDADGEEGLAADEEIEPIGADDEELDLAVLPKGALAMDIEDEEESEEEDLDDEEAVAVPAGKKGISAAEKKAQKSAHAKTEKPLPASAAKGKPPEKVAPAKAVPAKTVPAKPLVTAAQVKPAAAKSQPALVAKKPAPTPAKKPIPAKLAAKPAAKSKPPAKAAAKAPAKKPAKPAPKAKPAHPAAKPAKKAPAKPSKPAKKR